MRTSDETRVLFDTWSTTYDSDLKHPSGPLVGYQESLHAAATLIPVRRGSRVLDIGIGTGSFAALLTARGAQLWGIDPSEEMLARCHELHPAFSLAVGGFGAIPFAGEEFDVAISSFAFHETPPSKRQDALAGVVRILQPGGYLALLDIMFASKEAEAEAAKLSAAWDEAENYSLVGNLDRMLRVAGCSAILWTQTAPCHWLVVAQSVGPVPTAQLISTRLSRLNLEHRLTGVKKRVVNALDLLGNGITR